jgi:ComF family protein
VESSINIVKTILGFFTDLLLPERCISCKKKGSIICNNCTIGLRKAERETANNIYACYDYRDPIIKRAIWELKYHKRRHIGEKLGQLMYEEFIEDLSEIYQYQNGQSIYVIPVPISKDRLRGRGYNQAKILAKSFCNYDKKSFKLENNLITKNKKTTPQAKISNRTRRLNNVKGIFKITNKEFVNGKTFIIIDDVTTTGATFLEITKILKGAGAKKILCFAVAH